ncbi:OmpA family protein [Massilia sp. Leaf139]|uniref:OmpA family protein n=1 Tax=Massilia sp. Leaf139 TaxID=1736272 RepID=UPI000A5425F7|nr:OmpA family protein [Massilia sp. Leaf139]
MNARSLLAALASLAVALPALAQEGPVLKEGHVDVGTLVDALAPAEPKPPVRTRSIRMVRDDVGTAPVSSKPAKVSLTITFDTNSANLTPRARQSLDVVGQALASEKLAAARFAIEGHADPRGVSAANLKLSQLRAESVRDYLVDTARIDRARLDAVGKGDSEPIDRQNPDAPENRRVTIVNLSR